MTWTSSSAPASSRRFCASLRRLRSSSAVSGGSIIPIDRPLEMAHKTGARLIMIGLCSGASVSGGLTSPDLVSWLCFSSLGSGSGSGSALTCRLLAGLDFLLWSSELLSVDLRLFAGASFFALFCFAFVVAAESLDSNSLPSDFVVFPEVAFLLPDSPLESPAPKSSRRACFVLLRVYECSLGSGLRLGHFSCTGIDVVGWDWD
ncbi:hypothetical protein KCU88_g21, partial [Aureobasidium melanogenum]